MERSELTMRYKRIIYCAVKLLTAVTFMTFGNSALAGETDNPVREISFSEIEGVRVGNAQDDVAKTGVTVLCFPAGAKTGVNIRGGGPASRETPVLDPTKENIGIHAIVLSGGSAYGLAASRCRQTSTWRARWRRRLWPKRLKTQSHHPRRMIQSISPIVWD